MKKRVLRAKKEMAEVNPVKKEEKEAKKSTKKSDK